MKTILHEARLRCQFCRQWFWRFDRFARHMAKAHPAKREFPPHIEFTHKTDTETHHRD